MNIRVTEILLQLQRVRRLSLPKLAWLIIGVGILLRIAQYLFNRSLWVDEAMLASSVIRRSFHGLLEELDYIQAAPVGFLWMTRLSVEVFGDGEYALRLFPLMAGVISLVLFYRLAKQWISPRAVSISLAVFALSDTLIYYSSELKQYSSDVLFTLLIYLLASRVLSKPGDRSALVLLAGVGAITVWFSHPSVFVIAGVGLTLLAFYSLRGQWANVKWTSIAALFCGLSFFGSLQFPPRTVHQLAYLDEAHGRGFMPFPPLSLGDVQWFLSTPVEVLRTPVGLLLPGIGLWALLAGCLSVWSANKERLCIVLSPLIMALLASALHLYPFYGRFLLFIVPTFALLIGEGTEQIREKTSVLQPVIGVAFMVLLLLHPLRNAGHGLIRPRMKQESRQPIRYLKEHIDKGDHVYLSFASKPAFEYYAAMYKFPDVNTITGIWWGRQPWDITSKDFAEDLNQLRGKGRVWVLVVSKRKPLLLNHLDTMGRKLDSFENSTAGVYLYELRR